MALPNSIRNIQLGQGDQGAFLNLGRQQAENISQSVPESQAFNFALINLLKEYQGLGTKSLEQAGYNAQEQQAQRLMDTPSSLIGAAPGVQSGVRQAAAQALQPTISGIGQQQKSFKEQLASFGEILNVSRQIGDQLQSQQDKAKADLQQQVQFYINQGGAGALESLLGSKEGLDVVKKSGLDEGTLKAVLPHIKLKESQAKRKEELETLKTQAEIAKIQADAAAKVTTGSTLKTDAATSAQDLLSKFNAGKGTSAVGKSRFLQTFRLPGTAASDFQVTFDNLKSLLSLENIKYLKGQGQVSDAERKLLAEASSKLNLSQSEAEFKSTLEGVVRVLGGTQQQKQTRIINGVTYTKGSDGLWHKQ